MAIVYELNQPQPLRAPSIRADPRPPLVKVITSHEFDALPNISPEGRNGLAALEPAEMNFVELYPSFVIGSFAVPDKTDPTADPDRMSFYLDADRLIFIDDGTVATDMLAKVASSGILTKATTSHCLYALMKTLIADDFTWFSLMEDAMEKIEEVMLDHSETVSSQTIMGYRRAAMRMGSYYQQIAVMADLIADNENKVMSREEARAFSHVATHANHLADRAETLREYSLQLRELHQTQIDLKQNFDEDDNLGLAPIDIPVFEESSVEVSSELDEGFAIENPDEEELLSEEELNAVEESMAEDEVGAGFDDLGI